MPVAGSHLMLSPAVSLICATGGLGGVPPSLTPPPRIFPLFCPPAPSPMLILLGLLLFFVSFGASSSLYSSGGPNCPKECECDALPPTNSSWAVYCHQGGIDDARFGEIITRLPTTIRSLSIEAPPWRPRNRFRWNDNLNRFGQLRKLRLVNCGLPSMSRGSRLPSLELLDLRGNSIEHATMGNFGGMPNLKFLDLSRNSLSILPTGVFTYLKTLQSLSLSHNNITELSSNLLRGLRTLKALHLDGNRIPVKQINDLFADIPQLEELYLNHCHLHSLANLSLANTPTLRKIGLAGNDLKSVPTQELQILPFLNTVDLSHNTIPEVASCAFCGNNVTRLDLSHNLLGLAKEPFHPDAFRNCPLLELDLSFNHMNEFHSRWLNWAQEGLQDLRLSGNSIEDFHPELTETLPNLRKLHMAYNAIDQLPILFPPQYYHLQFFNISGNLLTNLPDNLNLLLPHLKDLDISHNKFQVLNQAGLEFINGLEKVWLQSNPWDCSCSVQHLQQHLRERHAYRHLLSYHEVQCNEPPVVRGAPVSTVVGMNDCAVLFGARYGLSQTSELVILLAAILLAATLLTLLLLCAYCMRERQYKGSYVTREHSRTPLTMIQHLSGSTSGSSAASEPLTPPLPPPPPKITAAAYFGI